MARGPRAKKTKPDAPGAGAAGDDAERGDNKQELTADERRALFVHHRSRWNEWQAKKKVADEFGKEVKTDLKADGFSLEEFKIADDLRDDDKKVREEIEMRLRVATWLGLPLGAQADMFGQPDRRPIAERAAEEGKQAGLEGRVRKPPYAPENPGHEAWMNGWYEGQKILAQNFGGDNRAAADAMEHSQ